MTDVARDADVDAERTDLENVLLMIMRMILLMGGRRSICDCIID